MYSTATELIQVADWFYRAPSCMGRRILVARMALAPFSPSTPMGRDSRTCIVSPGATTELSRLADCFYRATLYMGRHELAAVRTKALCSPSTPTARVLRTCTALRHALIILILRWAARIM